MMKKIILASTSPRRKSILEQLGLDFEVVPSPYTEAMETFLFDYSIIESLAYNKALAVAKEVKEEALVIGADTIVVNDNIILGKPKDEAEAFLMLKKLSNHEHFVVTSICVIDTNTMRKKITSTTSYVEFEKLSDEMISDYIKKFSPFDKAGSYGIQELPEGFVKNIRGSFENIMGLCPKSLNKVMLKLKR